MIGPLLNDVLIVCCTRQRGLAWWRPVPVHAIGGLERADLTRAK